ncbi:MAG: LexA family protein [Saprospiraceae bacterium]
MSELFLWRVTPALDFYCADAHSALTLPFVEAGISAGFPSPAEEHMTMAIDLNRELAPHPDATFYARVKGRSMEDAGIRNDDVLVIDRSLTARDNDVVVAFLNGEFTVKRFRLDAEGCRLLPANDDYAPIFVGEEDDFRIWGVVTYVIKNVRRDKSFRP